jgi:predicted HicB family RNase H-like nuclease
MADEVRGRGARKSLFLRIDEELHRQLADEARKSDRSLNGEITQRLRRSFCTIDEAAT